MTDEKRRGGGSTERDGKGSGKRGKISDARKQASTRHGDAPAPETFPTPGAHGQPDEGRERGELRDVAREEAVEGDGDDDDEDRER